MLRNAISAIATLVLVAVTGGPVEAQHTDFSGSWTLDRDASEFPQERRGGPVADEAEVAGTDGAAGADEAGLAVEVQRRSPSPRPMTNWSLNSSRSVVRARPSPTAWTAVHRSAGRHDDDSLFLGRRGAGHRRLPDGVNTTRRVDVGDSEAAYSQQRRPDDDRRLDTNDAARRHHDHVGLPEVGRIALGSPTHDPRLPTTTLPELRLRPEPMQ